MPTPADLPVVLLHMWLGAIPLVAGACAFGLAQLWQRRIGPALARRRRAARLALARARLTPAYFAQASVVSLRSTAPAPCGGLRAELRLEVAAADGDWPALATWLIGPEDIGRLRPGAVLPVLVLAGRPRRVFPNVEWARAAGAEALAHAPAAQRALAAAP
jgi:hypothetical protein